MYTVTADDGRTVSVPDVGESATKEQLIEICEGFGMVAEADILCIDPPPVAFVYDGCSGPAPEAINGIDIRLACLLHDLSYYCAYPKDSDAAELRAKADYRLGLRMLQLGADATSTDLYVGGVRAGGAWWPGAKWGYGRG